MIKYLITNLKKNHTHTLINVMNGDVSKRFCFQISKDNVWHVGFANPML